MEQSLLHQRSQAEAAATAAFQECLTIVQQSPRPEQAVADLAGEAAASGLWETFAAHYPAAEDLVGRHTEFDVVMKGFWVAKFAAGGYLERARDIAQTSDSWYKTALYSKAFSSAIEADKPEIAYQLAVQDLAHNKPRQTDAVAGVAQYYINNGDWDGVLSVDKNLLDPDDLMVIVNAAVSHCQPNALVESAKVAVEKVLAPPEEDNLVATYSSRTDLAEQLASAVGRISVELCKEYGLDAASNFVLQFWQEPFSSFIRDAIDYGDFVGAMRCAEKEHCFNEELYEAGLELALAYAKTECTSIEQLDVLTNFKQSLDARDWNAVRVIADLHLESLDEDIIGLAIEIAKSEGDRESANDLASLIDEELLDEDFFAEQSDYDNSDEMAVSMFMAKCGAWADPLALLQNPRMSRPEFAQFMDEAIAQEDMAVLVDIAASVQSLTTSQGAVTTGTLEQMVYKKLEQNGLYESVDLFAQQLEKAASYSLPEKITSEQYRAEAAAEYHNWGRALAALGRRRQKIFGAAMTHGLVYNSENSAIASSIAIKALEVLAAVKYSKELEVGRRG